MNFLEAMTAARNGKMVTRTAWSSNGGYVAFSDMDLVWGSIDHMPQHFHAMCGDIFADDWSEA